MSAAEEVELRLHRIKREAALVENHSDKLENREENVLKGESDISAADSEVCDFIKVNCICVNAVFSIPLSSCHYNTAT